MSFPQVNYPSQEELLNDVASLMQQMRRFKIDCEAKSDPKTEGRQVKQFWLKYPFQRNFVPDHKDQMDLGKGRSIPIFCGDRAA